MGAQSLLKPLVLASASPRRLELLAQIGIVPSKILAADLDETAKKDETPPQLALRLAIEKAQAIATQNDDCFVLAADTVVCVGRRILPKAEDEAQVRACLELLSGRGHRVYTGICVINPKARLSSRCVETRLGFKRLSDGEIKAYILSGQGVGKAGGYAIQGLAAAFVTKLIGSYSGVVGLPLFETRCLLSGAGYRDAC